MNISTTATAPSKALLNGWERSLLVLPTLFGLFAGLFPLLWPQGFADL
jgi:hypothetical protein